MPRAVYDPERDRRFYEEEKLKQEAQQAEEQQQYDEQTGEVQKEGEPQTVNPLQAIPNAIESGVGAVADLFGQGDAYRQRVAESREIQKEQDTAFEEEAYSTPIGTLASESVRVVGDVVTGTVEDTLNTADLLGDVVKKGVNSMRGVETKATEDPFSDRYTAAAYSFGMRGPRTEVGQFASKILKTAVIMRQFMVRAPKALIGLGTKGKGLKGAVASGLVPGAVADFITTTPEDGNFSAMVNNFIPEDSPLHDSFIFALRSEENDDPFTAKLKSAIEGGVIGTAADSLLWLMWGRKAGQAVINAGGTKEEALQKGVQAAKEKMAEVDSYNTKAIAKEGELFDENNADQLMQLLEQERSLTERIEALRASGISEVDPKLAAMRQTLEDVRKHTAEIDEKIANGYNPDDVRGIPQQDNAAFNKPADPNLTIKQQILRDTPPTQGTKQVTSDPFARPDITPIERGGSYHMMTDAQYDRMRYKPEVEELIRKYSGRVELQKMAAQLKRPAAEIIQNAAMILDDFRNALNSDIPEKTLISMMDGAGMLKPKTTLDAKLLSKEGILVTKALIGDTAEQIHSLAVNAASSRAQGVPVGNQIDRLVDRLSTLLEFHKTTAYDAGSTLQTFKRVIGMGAGDSADDNLVMSIKEVRDWSNNLKAAIRRGDPAADEEVLRLVNMMVLAGGDPSKQVKFLNAAITLGFKNATSSMYQSLLSGPITHLRNLLGNTYSTFERPFSAYLRGVIKGDADVRASAMAGLHGMVMGTADSFRIAKRTLDTGVSVNFNTKFAVDDFEAQAMIKQLKMAASTTGEQIGAAWVENSYRFVHNPWISWPNRALMASDDFFKNMSARYRLYSKSKYEAIRHSDSSLSPEEAMEIQLKKFSQGIDPATGRILDKDLLDYAERATFQQDPGAIVNALGNFVDSLPLGTGRLFLPFVRTPGNLAGYGFEHLPGINHAIRKFDKTYEKAFENGDKILMAELEGRSATGMMVMTTLLTTALFTDVTGNYPPDAAERKAWQAEGRPPMSIKVGNKWVSYQSIEPINSLMAIVADGVRLAKMGGAEAASRIAAQAWYSIVVSYTEKSFLAGLSEIGEILTPQNLNDASGLRMALNALNNYTPYSGVRRALANAMDPYLKETRGELDRMLVQAAPGYGNDLPSVTSWITGKPLNSIGGGLFNAVSPIRIQDVNDNYVAQQLSELGIPANTIVKTGRYGVNLEPQHRESLAKILAKSGLSKRLETIMRSDEWQAMAKAYRGRPVNTETFLNENEVNPPHIAMLKKEINKYKKTALQKLEKLDQSYLLLVAEEKYRRQRAAQGDFSKADIDTIRRYAGLN